ncbi:uncharacterized protein LOC120358750 [Solenopsis invicta]|uniref:uncharacterized protein LOC120358750 n=1 Tax=Solenopsis invicta TaxID=13686 RepID=UPI00193D8ECE|nr:uncharacterized protein LOC120358750 [Solenopsis invicta]
MNELLDQQITALQIIGRSLSNFKKIGKNNYTPAMIRQRMTTLKDTWATCLARHARLLQTVPEENRATLTYFRELQLELNQEVYETTLDYMATCLEELEPPVPASSSPLHSISTFEKASFSLNHLPPIRLPPFSGNLDEWENFRDRFTSLIIQNNDLTAFSRMHFLASSLSGRALDTIKSIQVTAANFEIAWKTLVSRYDNTRRLVEVHASALFNLPSVGRESALELNELRDRANRSIASLRNLNRSNDEILSDLLVYSVTQRLDHAIRKAWRLKTGDDASVPTYEALDKFLETRVRALEELTPQGSSKHARTARVTSASTTASSPACPLCAASHFINRCPQFLKKTPTQRMEVIKQANRCLNCLSYKHAAQACPSRYSCRTCQNRHHSMLHNDSASSSSNATSLSLTTTSDISAENKNNDHVSALCSTLPFAARKRVLLATARVNVISPANRRLAVRALLDQGSEITFISERLTQTLRLRRFSMPLEISTVGGVNIGKSRYAAQIQVAPINGSASALATTASILKSLTKYSPSQPRNHNEWTHLAHLALADPIPFSAEPIDAIIGADLYSEMLLDKVIKGAPGQPAAQATIFGWILSGPTSDPSPPGHVISVRHCASTDTLDRDIRRFWEVEEVSRKPPLTPEEQQCEDHFANTHSRGPDGRYIVRLPFKRGPPIEIGNSRATAERLLRALHRRLSVRPELKIEYSHFLCDYESLNHMHRVTEANDSSQTVYIPHHAVIRDGSATTHLRVVFNASCQTSNATSLNDHLLAGPKLQADLSAVILRWRLFRYVYAADITKMYRQIQIDPRDIDYQRILWNPEPNNPVLTYRLSTVTYGTACAPFLALRVIRQLVADDGAAFPLAASVLSENVYVDDVLFGAESVPRLKQIRTQVCSLLRQGKFELRKWSSNSAELLDDISVEDHGIACDKTLQSDESLKILGIIWSPSTDVFQFKVSFDSAPSTTKRSILSTISKLFDPLGWSTPVTVTAKMFIQTLWQSKLDWDDVLPPDLLIQWERIQFSLSELHGLSLPRWVQHEAQTEQCELHGFADASAQAYAAVVYLRLVSKSGVVTTQLLIGKSKVAPLTPLSIPRLELQAAVLLTRLLEFVRTTLSLSTAPCYCWTDSTVVLAWVTQHPSRWKTFVANRVSEVQTRIRDERLMETRDNR